MKETHLVATVQKPALYGFAVEEDRAFVDVDAQR
jgi:hypothetical protein